MADTVALAEAWNHGFGFIKTSVIKTVIELEIPDILQNHGAPLSLSALSSAVGCSLERLHRIMRFLAYHGIFKKTAPPPGEPQTSIYYDQTPVSCALTKDKLGPYVLLQGFPQGPSACITTQGLRSWKRAGFEDSGSDTLYEDPTFAVRVFRDAMACHARMTVSAMIENYGDEGFRGVGSLVDVGGSYGMAVGMLVKAYPWVRGICFDLPEVVAKASPLDGVQFGVNYKTSINPSLVDIFTKEFRYVVIHSINAFSE